MLEPVPKLGEIDAPPFKVSLWPLQFKSGAITNYDPKAQTVSQHKGNYGALTYWGKCGKDENLRCVYGSELKIFL